MLDYIISIKGIKTRQVGMLAVCILLILSNFAFFLFERTGNSLIVMLLTSLFVLGLNFLGSYIYQIHFLNEDILISNFFHGEKKCSVSEFCEITTLLSMAGIYKLNLRNGETYLFTIERHIRAKNLFNIDSNKYAKELTKDLKERIASSN